MVSGFLTSPCDHWRMSSAVARPIRSSSKKLTSSTRCIPFQGFSLSVSDGLRGAGVQAQAARTPAPALDLFDRARLAPGQVDAELLRRSEDVLVGVAHLDGHAVAGEHLD